jgi:hypothetical protein
MRASMRDNDEKRRNEMRGDGRRKEVNTKHHDGRQVVVMMMMSVSITV